MAQNGLPDREVKENAKTTSLATHDLHIAVLGVDGQIAAGTWVTARAELEEVKATVLSDGTFACECSGNAAKLTVFHPVLGEVQLLLEIPSPLPGGISSLETVPVVVQFKGPGVARLSIERFSGDGASPPAEDPPAGGGGEGLGTCDFEVAASCQVPDNLGQGPGGTLASLSDVNPTILGAGLLAADDFNIDGIMQVNEVCFWGIYIDFAIPTLDCSPQVDNFTITYYADLGGCPGAVVGGPFNVRIVGKAVNGRIISGAQVFEYTASHAAVFFLPGCYWISVQNDTTPGTCSWFWQSAAGNGRSVSTSPGPFVCPIAAGDVNDFDFGWCLGFNGAGVTLGDPSRCVPPPPPGPANDACVDRIPIGDGLTPYDTTSASTDGLDSNGIDDCIAFGDPQIHNDIWFNYTATCTGTLTVSTCNDGDPTTGDSTYDSKIAIYDGCSTASCPFGGNEIGCNDDGPGCAGFSTIATAPVVSGQCYKIRIGGFGAGDSGSATASVSCSGAPPPVDNNLCSDRVDIFDGATPFDTTGSTTDGAPASCGLGGSNDIWYDYTATCTGDLTVSTCQEDGGDAFYDTHLTVYDGCACNPNDAELGCNDDADDVCTATGTVFASRVIVPVVAGQCYRIRVGGFAGGDSGAGTLAVSCEVSAIPPNNDQCENRRPAFNGLNPFDTINAGTDGPLPSCGGAAGGSNDVWFNYTATHTGGLTVTTCEELGGSADYDTHLVVYDGCLCPANTVNELGCNDDDPDNACGGFAGGFHSTVKVPVVNGNCYKIRVGGFDGAESGTGMLNIIKQIPTGACCLPDASCLDGVEEEDCAVAGGEFFVDEVCEAHVFEILACANPFEDISGTGTQLFLGDDDGEVVPIGFTFSFFKDPYTDIAVTSNGYLTFGEDLTDFSNDSIPDDNDPNDYIAPFWDDLNPSQGGTIHFQTLGTPGQHWFIAQWTGVPEFFATGANTFQAVLFEADNCIEFRYGDFTADTTGTDVTIGVENQDGSDGFQVDASTIVAGSCVSLCPSQEQLCCPLPTVQCSVVGVEDDESASDWNSLSLDTECDLLITFSGFLPAECGTLTVTAVIDIGCALIPIESGQIVELDCELPDDGSSDGSSSGSSGGSSASTSSEDCEFEFHADGTLEIEAPSAILIVTATDESGNVATCMVSLCSICPVGGDDSSSAGAF